MHPDRNLTVRCATNLPRAPVCRATGFVFFWGCQLVIDSAAITLPLGITQSKEYAELEWPLDLLLAVVSVSYAVVFLGTIVKRRVSHNREVR